MSRTVIFFKDGTIRKGKKVIYQAFSSIQQLVQMVHDYGGLLTKSDIQKVKTDGELIGVYVKVGGGQKKGKSGKLYYETGFIYEDDFSSETADSFDYTETQRTDGLGKIKDLHWQDALIDLPKLYKNRFLDGAIIRRGATIGIPHFMNGTSFYQSIKSYPLTNQYRELGRALQKLYKEQPEFIEGIKRKYKKGG